jgi:primosomal protein N'
VIRETGEEACLRYSEKLASGLQPLLEEGVSMTAPEPCAITKIGGRDRMQILLLTDDPRKLRSVLLRARRDGVLTPGERVAVDVDPVALL